MSYNVFSDTGEQKFINPAGDQEAEMSRITICVQLQSSGILES
jgi:hypothetical protein